MDATALLPH